MWFRFRVVIAKENGTENTTEHGILQAGCYADAADYIDAHYDNILKRIELLELIDTSTGPLIFREEEEYVFDKIRDNWLQRTCSEVTK